MNKYGTKKVTYFSNFTKRAYEKMILSRRSISCRTVCTPWKAEQDWCTSYCGK